MDPISQLIAALIGAGPMGIVAGVFFFLYLRKEKRCEELTDKIMALATGMTGTMKDLTTAVDAALKDRGRQ